MEVSPGFRGGPIVTQEEAKAGFLADLQAVLNKWEAELEGTYDGDIQVSVFSPFSHVVYDEAKPYTPFTESRFYAQP